VQFYVRKIELARITKDCVMIMMRHISFTEQLNLEATIGRFRSWSRKYWKKLVSQINTEKWQRMDFWKSGILLLKSLF